MSVVAPAAVGFAVLTGLVGLLLSNRARGVAAGLAVTSSVAVCVLVLVGLVHDADDTIHFTAGTFADLDIELTLRMNTTALVVATMVAAVALAVQVYSVTYLANDSRYVPYAAQVSLFVAAMLAVVFAGDLITVLIGWEVMGLCSYLLIGHDRAVAAAPKAAVKAFLITRVGDIGFLLGIVTLAVSARSFQFDEVFAADHSTTTLTAAGLLLLAGVAGKSAQFPLHSWLPDAMAGPTPVSALIHAATMVAAGVYVLLTLRPIFTASDTTMWATAIVGSVTLLLGVFAAAVSDDLKRVLAYSTMSQLGSMVAVCGLAGEVSAGVLFQLLSHGAFKALLFLCAGVLIHLVGSNSMAAMGGMWRVAPVTSICAAVGLLAAAGLPPVAGFWSKEALLHAATHADGDASALVVGALWLSVPISGWYCARIWLMVFAGQPSAAGSDSRPGLRWPVLALATATVALGGLAFVNRQLIAGWGAANLRPQLGPSLVSIALIVLGVGAAVLAGRRRHDPAWVFGPLRGSLAAGFGFDALIRVLVVRPVQWVARGVRAFDERRVDGAVHGLAAAVSLVGIGGERCHANLARYVTIAFAGAVVLGAGGWAWWMVAG